MSYRRIMECLSDAVVAVLVLIGLLADSATAQVVTSPSGSVLGTGRGPDAGEQALLDQLIDEIDLADPGFKQEFQAWQAAGGEVGLLTGGFAVKGKVKAAGVADSDTILIYAGDSPDRSQAKARLYHEFMHAKRGWQLGGGAYAVDPCGHAGIWADTIHFMLIPCDIDRDVTCAQFRTMLRIYKGYAAMCGPGAPACVISSPPLCCKK